MDLGLIQHKIDQEYRVGRSDGSWNLKNREGVSRATNSNVLGKKRERITFEYQKKNTKKNNSYLQ